MVQFHPKKIARTEHPMYEFYSNIGMISAYTYASARFDEG
jgi:hypothetical protein